MRLHVLLITFGILCPLLVHPLAQSATLLWRPLFILLIILHAIIKPILPGNLGSGNTPNESNGLESFDTFGRELQGKRWVKFCTPRWEQETTKRELLTVLAKSRCPSGTTSSLIPLRSLIRYFSLIPRTQLASYMMMGWKEVVSWYIVYNIYVVAFGITLCPRFWFVL